MSRHREMLRALVRLGKKPLEIASAVPMSSANVTRTLRADWPVQKRYIEPLEDYTYRTLRETFEAARSHEKGAIADIYLRLSGHSIVAAPELSPIAKRASYVAWLLCIDPSLVFPFGPDLGPEADEHLWTQVRAVLDGLIAEARRVRDHSPEAIRYTSTLSHADDVIEYKADPADNGWFENRLGFRRGVYTFPNVIKHGRGNR